MFARAGKPPLIGAHRGASGDAPENTIAAFDLALEQGAELLEFDVHRSADGELVVHHDYDLTRTSGVPGEIRELPAAVIVSRDVGAWRGELWVGQRVPTLELMLARYGTRAALNIEIKVNREPYPGIEDAVAAAVREHSLLDNVIVSSFNVPTVARLRAVDTGLQVGLLAEDRPDAAITAAQELGATAVHLETGLITEARVRRIHAAHMFLLAWTVDDPVEIVRLTSLGVDAILSNYPKRLAAVMHHQAE